MFRLAAIVATLLVAFVAFTACSNDNDVEPTNRNIEITAFEVKGTTNTGDLDAPTIDPSTLSAGFGYKAPGFDAENPTNWRVSSYMWTPGNITVFEGDSVNLHTFILNGNHHAVRVVDPDGTTVASVDDMNRGRDYNVSFKTEKAGVYKFICDTHGPTMTADILVLPN